MHSYLQRMICFVVSRSIAGCAVVGEGIDGDVDVDGDGKLLAMARFAWESRKTTLAAAAMSDLDTATIVKDCLFA